MGWNRYAVGKHAVQAGVFILYIWATEAQASTTRLLTLRRTVQISPYHENHTALRDRTPLNRVRQADQPEIMGPDR